LDEFIIPACDLVHCRDRLFGLASHPWNLIVGFPVQGVWPMRHLKLAAGGIAALALISTSITPAMARWYGGGGYGWNSWGGGHGWGRKHRRGDDDTAEVLAGVLLGAILVGVASSASKKSKERRTYPDEDRRRPDDRRSEGRINSENAAVDACAIAAEQRGGEMARVRDISNVRSSSDGWDVEGALEQRTSWRDRAPKQRNFTCSVRYGEVDSVYIDGDAVAAR
jgi:hypothetical protein